MIGNISGQKSLFGIALGSILDPNNRWVKLSNKMPWTKIGYVPILRCYACST